MDQLNRNARIAGLVYPLMGLPAVFSYQYVPHKLIIQGDSSATAQRIMASESLFRLGIVSELVSVTAFLFLARALYRLLKDVDRSNASLMLTLVAVSVPLSFANVLNETAVLALLRPTGTFAFAFTEVQRQAAITMFLTVHMDGLRLAAIFWGLWLFPFGALVMRSGFLPKILGVLLILACFGWITDTAVWLLVPRYTNVVDTIASVIGGIGEFPISLWLLFVGVRPQRTANSSSGSNWQQQTG